MKPNTPARYYGGLRRRRVPVGFRLWLQVGRVGAVVRWRAHFAIRYWLFRWVTVGTGPGWLGTKPEIPAVFNKLRKER